MAPLKHPSGWDMHGEPKVEDYHLRVPKPDKDGVVLPPRPGPGEVVSEAGGVSRSGAKGLGEMPWLKDHSFKSSEGSYVSIKDSLDQSEEVRCVKHSSFCVPSAVTVVFGAVFCFRRLVRTKYELLSGTASGGAGRRLIQFSLYLFLSVKKNKKLSTKRDQDRFCFGYHACFNFLFCFVFLGGGCPNTWEVFSFPFFCGWRERQ